MAKMPRPTKKTPAEILGERIRARRVKLGLSQDEVASKAGMALANYSRLENGRSGSRGPTLSSLMQVSRALGVQPAELLPHSV